PTGVLLQTWALIGSVPAASGGGFGIVSNTLVYHNGTLWQGTIGATTINVSPVAGVTMSPTDFASCPIGQICKVSASIDTGYQCLGAAPIAVSATGDTPLVWSVISGNATIAGSGSNVTIDATTTSSILVKSTSGLCPDSMDTVVIIVPTAIVNAGLDDTVLGCASYRDTLSGSLSGNTPGVVYTPAWEPVANVVANGNTYSPIVTLTGPMEF